MSTITFLRPVTAKVSSLLEPSTTFAEDIDRSPIAWPLVAAVILILALAIAIAPAL